MRGTTLGGKGFSWFKKDDLLKTYNFEVLKSGHGELLPKEAAELLDVALRLDIILYGDGDLHRRALKLAESFSLPATHIFYCPRHLSGV